MSTQTAEPVLANLAGRYEVDPVHSGVEFEVEHLGATKFRAGFKGYEARLVADENGPRVEGEVAVDSITVDQEDLRAHLFSPDFFDVERHPKISFASKAIEVDGEEVVVTGELQIKEHTGVVTARGRIGEPFAGMSGETRFPLELSATVDRHEYGLGWSMDLPDGRKVVGDEVTLIARLELVGSEEA